MPARVDLARLLGRVRRRLRLTAALQGAVVGGCAALAVWGAAVIAARWGARGSGLSLAGATVALLVAGLVGGLVRRIPLNRCARAIDRAVGGEDGRNGDRTLAALSLMTGAGAESPMIEAAIADAARMARSDEIARRAAPWRRPRGLGVATALAAVMVVASWWPAARPSAAPAVAVKRPGPRGERLDPRLLVAERTTAATAAAQAAAAKDAELARLARELERILDGLAEGQLDRADALERLARLAKEAERAAEDGRASEKMLQAAAEVLEREKQTRALAEAMREPEESASKKAAEDLADKASKMSSRDRDRLSESLGKAGTAGARASEQAPGQEGRRLGSAANQAGTSQEGSEERNRRLKRLERDLSDGADQCRENPEACRQALKQLGADLPDVNRDARQSSSRERLGKAMQQMRERLKRQGQSSPDRAEDDFERAAGGMRQMQAGNPSGEEGQEGAEGAPVQAPDSTGSESAGAGAGARTSASADDGEGMGSEAGGDPLGARDRGKGARGQQHEIKLRDGAGPSRSEVIEAGAHKGFARSEYERVFEDYSAAVEESLDTTAVPPARRYLVRRYFQLIRPREGEAPRGR
ncbi:MAG TPA: hypothetical protein VN914_18935 [Polyangia bacterium]|nr:hypothetical protein [Polyangia bacterium]